MAISRSQMQRQLQNRGGITNLSPRQNFGLGSSLKKFVRKIIPNEVSKVATAAAPFVAPFNPALAAGMAGIGSFDQSGSISDALKRGALTYGGGQAARYIGGADFQALPGTQDFGGLSGFTSFSSPIGDQTGLGKFFSDRRMPNTEIAEISEVAETGPKTFRESMADINLQRGTTDTSNIITPGYNDMLPNLYETASNVGPSIDVIKAETITKDPSFVSSVVNKFQNKDYKGVGGEVLNAARKVGKAVFYKDGQLDKPVVLGAAAFALSFAEAKAIANEVGIDDYTEAQYDEDQKAEKQAEYATYLTNFFGGKKDGGRIGFAEGSEDITILEKIKDFAGGAVEKLGEEAMYKFNEFVYNEPALYGYMANNYDANTLQNPKAREEIRTFYDKLNPKKQEYIEMYLDSIAYPDDDSYKDWLFSKPSKISFPTDERMEDHNKQYDFLPYGKDAYSIRAKTDKDLSKFMKADGGRIGLDEGTPKGGIDMIALEENVRKYPEMVNEITDIEFGVAEPGEPTDQGPFIRFDKEKEEAEMLKEILRELEADGGRIGFAGGTSKNVLGPARKAYNSVYGYDKAGNEILVKDLYDDFGSFLEMFRMQYHATGGRVGLKEGTGSKKPYGRGIESAVRQIDPLQSGLNELKSGGGGIPMLAFSRLEKSFLFKNLAKLGGADRSFTMPQLYKILSNPSKFPKDAEALKAFLKIKGFQKGGDVGTAPEVPVRTNAAGVKELDYRQSGGFVPVGVKEKADDVPAMLSKNEFVLTADAVRGIGGGSVEKGSEKLYNVMKQAEQVGKA